MGENHRIHLSLAEHINILALLLLIGYIVNNLFLVLFFVRRFAFLIRRCLGIFYDLRFPLIAVFVYRIRFFRVSFVDLQALRKSQILAVQILKQNIIRHLFAEFIIL